tara:strand:- start:681 stop:1022 length:342 start_codon:yes stop_codon:yes gene_type:complete
MGRIAIIENNVITNIITGDSDFANNYDGTAVIVEDDSIGIGCTYTNKKFGPPNKSQEEKEADGRFWRNMELRSTDWIVPLNDYPKHAEWLTYREELRDWPSTENFPDTKPSKP